MYKGVVVNKLKMHKVVKQGVADYSTLLKEQARSMFIMV